MTLDQFKFMLPMDRIAAFPRGYYKSVHAVDKEQGWMMVLHKDTGNIEHKKITDILDYLSPGDVMVLNDSNVMPAEFLCTKASTNVKTTGKLLREIDPEKGLWDVQFENSRIVREGNKMLIDDSQLYMECVDNTSCKSKTMKMSHSDDREYVMQNLKNVLRVPMPPDIEMIRGGVKDDAHICMTDFGANAGSLTPYSTGLHISKLLLKKFEIRDVITAFVTLHQGIENWDYISVEDLDKHNQASARMAMSDTTANIINNAWKERHKVIAVGGSVARVMEQTCKERNARGHSGWNHTFIHPPYNITAMDAMLINFYLPMSTGLITACTFGGYEEVMEAYRTAMEAGYMFGTYGDCLLII